MIGQLRGTLLAADGGQILLDVGGVGYEVQVPMSLLHELPSLDNEYTVVVRQIFREDSVSLYGFKSRAQRALFDLLLGVKGCGPKVAMSLLGTLGDVSIAEAVHTENAKLLATAPGIGMRLAERLLLELKDKIDMVKIEVSPAGLRPKTKPADDLVAALLALGYRRSDAEAASDAVSGQADTLEEQLKLALQFLRK